MAKPNTKRPPGLGPQGKALWDALQRDYRLDDAGAVALLTVACEARDRVAEARQIVARDGSFVKDRFGQVRAHPGLSIERDARAAMVSALRALNLSSDVGDME